MGKIYEQDFFALQHLPGRSIEFPFTAAPFTALIDIDVPQSEEALRDMGLQLLRHGLRAAVCRGVEAERMSEILDELVDEYVFHHEGRTPYASVHDEESLEDLIEYFILPNGLAETGLLIVVGEEPALRARIRAFNQIAGVVREALEIRTG